jgi:hypothetical protein
VRERLSIIEWLGLGWGAVTFLMTLVLGLGVAPYLVSNLGELVSNPPLFTRVVLHPVFVLGIGSVPLASALAAIKLGLPRTLRTGIILAGALWSVLTGVLMVIAMYLPIFTMADHIQAG